MYAGSRICLARRSRAGPPLAGVSLDITPIIDITFLLILSFALVCRFVDVENPSAAVPDGCEAARSDLETGPGVVTLTVTRRAQGDAGFVIGSEGISAMGDGPPAELIQKLTQQIDKAVSAACGERDRTVPADRKVVVLRIDKDVHFGTAQYALAAVAGSCATDVRLAVLSGKSAKIEN